MTQAIDDNARVLIIGAARSGIAAARALRRTAPSAAVTISDRDPAPAAADEAAALEGEGVSVELGREDNALLDGCELVIKSPGVPNEISLLSEARQLGIPVIGEVEFAWRHLENIFVGVTGTNGKTTTTELIGHVINGSGRRCRVAGNVGTPLSSLVGRAYEDDILIVELSSFQLEDTVDFRPDIAVLLNLTEDHLDRHPDLEHYFESKMMIFANQGPDDVAVVNADDPNSRRPVPGHARRLSFSRGCDSSIETRPAVCLSDGRIRADLGALGEAAASVRGRLPWTAAGHGPGGKGGRNDTSRGEISEEEGYREITEWARVKLRGEHNQENALAAVAVCLGLGLSPDETAEGLAGFPGVRHRLQEVAEIDGVVYVNDSKATNVDAAIKALTAYETGVHLILGGSRKGCSFDELARVAAGKVEQVLLIGEAAPAIARSFELAGRAAELAGDLEAAVSSARAAASPGDVVLLAPACASFDQYDNYEERGDHFIRIVQALEKESN